MQNMHNKSLRELKKNYVFKNLHPAIKNNHNSKFHLKKPSIHKVSFSVLYSKTVALVMGSEHKFA